MYSVVDPMEAVIMATDDAPMPRSGWRPASRPSLTGEPIFLAPAAVYGVHQAPYSCVIRPTLEGYGNAHQGAYPGGIRRQADAHGEINSRMRGYRIRGANIKGDGI
jgi:hypothetical protein